MIRSRLLSNRHGDSDLRFASALIDGTGSVSLSILEWRVYCKYSIIVIIIKGGMEKQITDRFNQLALQEK